MAQPTAYNRETDFAQQDGDDTNHAALNAELDGAAQSINEIRANLAIIQRDDGQLKTGIIGAEQLAPNAFGAVSQQLGQAVQQAEQARNQSLDGAKSSNEYAEQARLKAEAAEQSAGNAASSARSASAAAQYQFNGIYFGAKPSNPGTDPNGNPPNDGDFYYNTVDKQWRAWDAEGNRWVAPIVSGQFRRVEFLAGTGFSAGVTTSLSIPSDPRSASNVFVHFDGELVQPSRYTVTGVTLNFSDPIPVGTAVVDVAYIEVVLLEVTNALLTFETKAAAVAAASTMPSGSIVEVQNDETNNAFRSRYKNEAGTLTLLSTEYDAQGLPRFAIYPWNGRTDKTPPGDIPGNGHQVLDLQYPNMRAEVLATQHYCTESEWQADVFKRQTHWSTGDGSTWMRCPDPNGVQPGSIGGWYFSGSNPAGGLTGTSKIDAMRNLVGSYSNGSWRDGGANDAATGVFTVTHAAGSSPGGDTNYGTKLTFNAANALPPGTTTDPITGEFRPRTFYGIWMIRMYGRIINAGLLNAAALNSRMDLIDARVSTCEASLAKLPVDAQWVTKTSERAYSVTYTNPYPYEIEVGFVMAANAAGVFQSEVFVDGTRLTLVNSYAPSAGTGDGIVFSVPAYKTYRIQNLLNSYMASWREKVKV